MKKGKGQTESGLLVSGFWLLVLCQGCFAFFFEAEEEGEQGHAGYFADGTVFWTSGGVYAFGEYEWIGLVAAAFARRKAVGKNFWQLLPAAGIPKKDAVKLKGRER